MDVTYTPYYDERGTVQGIVVNSRDITELKKAEERLKESEYKYRLLAENAGDVIFVTDPDFNFTYVSPSVLRQRGFTPVEFTALPLEQRYPPKAVDFIKKRLRYRKQLVAQGHKEKDSTTWEMEAYTKAGDRIAVETIITPLFDKDDEFKGFVGVSRDITAGKNAEAALQHSERRLSLVMKATQDGIWDNNTKTGECYYSPRWYEMLGCSPGEFQAGVDNWLKRIHPDDRPRVEKHIAKVMQGRLDAFEFEFRMQHKSGHWITVLNKGIVAERDEYGMPCRFIGAHSDITENTYTRQRYQTIFSCAPLGIFTSSLQGRFLEVNQAMAEMLGYSTTREVLASINNIGKDIYAQANRRREVVELLNKENSRTLILDNTYRRKDGTTFTGRLHAAILKDPRTDEPYLLGMVQDVTEQLTVEQNLKHNQERLQETQAAARIGWWECHAADQSVQMSDEYRHILGYSPDEVEPSLDFFLSHVHREDKEAVSAAARRALDTEEGFSIDFRMLNKQGAVLWVRSQGTVLTNAKDGSKHIRGFLQDISDWKHTRDRLQDTEKELTLILESITDMVALHDMEQRIIWANRTAAESVKATPEELKGRYCYDVWGRNSEPCPDCPVLKTFTTRKRHSIERCDHNGRHWRLLSFPVFDGDGKLIGAVEAGRDVTEIKLSEQALNAERRRKEVAMEAGNFYAWEIDPDTREFSADPGYIEFLGHDPDSVSGDIRDLLPFIPTEYHPNILETFEQIRSGETETYDLEHPVVRGDGTTIHIRAVGKLIHEGRQRKLFGITQDITRQKQAQDILDAERKRFFTIFNHIPGQVYLLRIDHTLAAVNTAFLEHYGEIGDRCCFEIIHGRDKPCKTCPAFDVLESCNPVIWEHVDQHSSARQFHCVPFQDVDGSPLALVMSLDITERKRLERELYFAKETAEASARMKGKFLADMSHEVRTPLNGLLGMLQLLKTTALDENQTDFLNTALDSGRTLLSVLNDILDFSKVEAGKIEFVVKPFSLENLMKSTVRLFLEQGMRKKNKIHYEIAPDVPAWVNGDESRIRQILVNLVGNAMKFTQQGEILIRVNRGRIAPQAGFERLHFAVSDTGIGIPKDRLSTIFEPFSQIDPTYSGRKPGTGLGLSIVKKLVELMGGDISVVSQSGRGSTFSFQLSLETTDPVKEETNISYTCSKYSEYEPLRILIVEDNHINSVILQKLLEIRGHTVSSVKTGCDALSLLAKERFDIILMDIQLPDLDGMEATKRIRDGETGDHHKKVPIIAVTAHAMKGDRERFLQAGMNDYLPKPVNEQDLFSLLDQCSRSLPDKKPRRDN